MTFRVGVASVAATLCILAVAITVSAQNGSSGTDKDSLFAAMSGKNEIPDADPDGQGSFAGTFDGTQLCYGYSVKNIANPTAAHIHTGTAGKNGGIVVPLATPSSGDPGAVSACTEVPAELKADILRRPATYYVNVHNADFPGGAVRGQLFVRAP